MGNYKKEIELHFQLMYPNWLQQAERMCRQKGLYHEAKDILQEVICYVLEHYANQLEELYLKKEKKYTALDALIMKILTNNIYSTKAPYHQKYLKKQPPIDREKDPERLQYIGEESLPDQWEILEIALERLRLSDNQLKIFRHYYIEHKKLCDWPGPESAAKACRICKRIISLLKEEIKKFTDFPEKTAKNIPKVYFIIESS